jgi:hypothetical protein
MILGDNSRTLPRFDICLIQMRQIGRPGTRIGHQSFGQTRLPDVAKCNLGRKRARPRAKRAAQRPLQDNPLSLRAAALSGTDVARVHSRFHVVHVADKNLYCLTHISIQFSRDAEVAGAERVRATRRKRARLRKACASRLNDHFRIAGQLTDQDATRD